MRQLKKQDTTWSRNRIKRYLRKQRRSLYGMGSSTKFGMDLDVKRYFKPLATLRDPTLRQWKWRCKLCGMKTTLKGTYHWESECSKNYNRKLKITNEGDSD